MPTLLPFCVLSGLLLRSNLINAAGNGGKVLAQLIAVVCGFVFGFPIGAKLAADFYKSGYINCYQATILCITTNNFSLMYVFGFVLPTLFAHEPYNPAGYLLLYAIPLFFAIILLFFKRSKGTDAQKNMASRFQFDMQIIDASIICGFESLIKICGYMVLFSVASQLLQHILPGNNPVLIFLLGNLEISNGISLLLGTGMLSPSQKHLMALQLLSLGGISGIAQTASILQGTDLSVKHYVIGKISLSLLLMIVCFNIYNG